MVLARYPANFSYWPVVDSYAEDPFLPLDPLEALMTGRFTKVPFISGTVILEVLSSSHHLLQLYLTFLYIHTGLLCADCCPAAGVRRPLHHQCAAQDQQLPALWTGDCWICTEASA